MLCFFLCVIHDVSSFFRRVFNIILIRDYVILNRDVTVSEEAEEEKEEEELYVLTSDDMQMFNEENEFWKTSGVLVQHGPQPFASAAPSETLRTVLAALLKFYDAYRATISASVIKSNIVSRLKSEHARSTVRMGVGFAHVVYPFLKATWDLSSGEHSDDDFTVGVVPALFATCAMKAIGAGADFLGNKKMQHIAP